MKIEIEVTKEDIISFATAKAIEAGVSTYLVGTPPEVLYPNDYNSHLCVVWRVDKST